MTDKSEYYIVAAVGGGEDSILTGHNGEMDETEAQARCDKANKDATEMNIETRYEVRTLSPEAFRKLVPKKGN